jgi:hypothetical protein
MQPTFDILVGESKTNAFNREGRKVIAKIAKKSV